MPFSGVQAVASVEDGTDAALRGRVAEGPGGVFEFGTHQEDGPVTWEAPTFPRAKRSTRAGTEVSDVPAFRMGARWRRLRKATQLEGRPKARGTGAEAEGRRGVGGPHTSYDGGELLAPGPTRAKAHISGTEREGDVVRPGSWLDARADTNLGRER